MIKSVQGFLTTDGRFFQSEFEAEVNEAEEDLRKAMETDGIDGDTIERALHGIKKYRPLVHRLCQAELELVKQAHAKGNQATESRAKRRNDSPKPQTPQTPQQSN